MEDPLSLYVKWYNGKNIHLYASSLQFKLNRMRQRLALIEKQLLSKDTRIKTSQTLLYEDLQESQKINLESLVTLRKKAKNDFVSMFSKYSVFVLALPQEWLSDTTTTWCIFYQYQRLIFSEIAMLDRYTLKVGFEEIQNSSRAKMNNMKPTTTDNILT